MTRLPKNRGITQAEEDKSLILRHFRPGITLRYLAVEKYRRRVIGLSN